MRCILWIIGVVFCCWEGMCFCVVLGVGRGWRCVMFGWVVVVVVNDVWYGCVWVVDFGGGL